MLLNIKFRPKTNKQNKKASRESVQSGFWLFFFLSQPVKAYSSPSLDHVSHVASCLVLLGRTRPHISTSNMWLIRGVLGASQVVRAFFSETTRVTAGWFQSRSQHADSVETNSIRILLNQTGRATSLQFVTDCAGASPDWMSGCSMFVCAKGPKPFSTNTRSPP